VSHCVRFAELFVIYVSLFFFEVVIYVSLPIAKHATFFFRGSMLHSNYITYTLH
jgi:hypothetical protein